MARKKDDRKNQRIPVPLLVDYKSPNGNYLFDFCKDLGTGGVFIETDKPMEVESEVSLTFTIPDSKETLEAKGKVLWVQSKDSGQDISPGMGIQFKEFTQEQRRIMEDFISRYHKENQSENKPA